jgi:hypothetical protein
VFGVNTGDPFSKHTVQRFLKTRNGLVKGKRLQFRCSGNVNEQKPKCVRVVTTAHSTDRLRVIRLPQTVVNCNENTALEKDAAKKP